MKKKIYSVPASCGFTDVLAQKFLDEYRENRQALADVLFLLPNRRAVKALADAFVRAGGMSPMLLPRMMPLGEAEEDELFLTGGGSREYLSGMFPAISSTERCLLFTKIIMSKPGDFGMEKMSLNQACYLAQELSGLIDLAENEQLDFAGLADLVPDDYAVHWQETLRFLKIITEFWPLILEERQVIDPVARRNRLLEAQCDIWQRNRPEKRIVIAGTTATYPLMRKMVKTVLELPNGELWLSALDRKLDDESWAVLDETHPQFELKQLLDYLDMPRELVTEVLSPENREREAFASEVMRPAGVTNRWLEIGQKGFDETAWRGVNLLNCGDLREEALAIALIMREVLETPEKTAALVTSDRNLARRVSAELERWDVTVDDSAGRPLSLTAVGIFLRLTVQAAESESRLKLLALLKHPLLRMGQEAADIRLRVRDLEKWWRKAGGQVDVCEAFLQEVSGKLQELSSLLQHDKVLFKNLLACNIKTAELLAGTPQKSGEQVLWQGDDGEAAAQFIADLYENAEVLGEIETKEYGGLLDALMSGVNVRPKFGGHPRLKILGPIEARLNRFDVTIIGEVNEGVWPKTASSDPWMSRPMKKDFGFPLPEKAIGIAALDFFRLLCGETVYLTRAERVQGTPMVKSRWWLRLETVLKALGQKVADRELSPYGYWAKQLDEPEKVISIKPPAPRPEIRLRPNALSASAIEKWMRDPYEIYARYILKLKRLEEVEEKLDFSDYGTIVHAVLQEFNNKYPEQLPENAREELLKLGEAYFTENKVVQETRAFWWPNFEKSVDWFLQQEKEYRPQIARVHTEVSGSLTIKTAGRDFTLKAIADRVDETKDGKINIIDYKTGKARKVKEVCSGKAPQLPIEGLIAEGGGFTGIPPREAAKLIYWQLGRQETEISEDIKQVLQDNLEILREYISCFEFESTAYVCQPNPKNIPEYSDYEHLARIKEWSVKDNDD
ncbi:MAG: double-strand break repair protein AddB [Alphaproteobacteria bacterium]|nr:double-strand break repair protein AddB [Alphaproteobacteria bacterium]